MKDILKNLMAVPSLSGRESAIADLIEKEIRPFADKIYRDPMGNLIAVKRGKSDKKLMLAAHMDEIGFLVTHIQDNGYIRFSNLGGVNYKTSANTFVKFANGTVGILAPASKDKSAPTADDFYIDIGASSKKEAEKKVKTGDFAIFAPDLKKLYGTRYAGHPMDDKIGCAMLIKAMQSKVELFYETYFVFTVQEEVGCRGAKTAAFGIAPDFAIAYDVTRTGDTPDASQMEVSLGGGAAIKIKDSSVLCDLRMVEYMKNTAKENKIKYQLEILKSGGTDTSSIQMAGSGAVVGAISIPTRYIHSCTEMIDMKDCAAGLALTERILEREIVL